MQLRKKTAAAEHESEAAEDDPMAMEIGRHVLKYFPDLSIIKPGSEEENAIRYKPLAAVLRALSGEKEKSAVYIRSRRNH